jgi:hypothetical protein
MLVTFNIKVYKILCLGYDCSEFRENRKTVSKFIIEKLQFKGNVRSSIDKPHEEVSNYCANCGTAPRTNELDHFLQPDRTSTQVPP